MKHLQDVYFPVFVMACTSKHVRMNLWHNCVRSPGELVILLQQVAEELRLLRQQLLSVPALFPTCTFVIDGSCGIWKVGLERVNSGWMLAERLIVSLYIEQKDCLLICIDVFRRLEVELNLHLYSILHARASDMMVSSLLELIVIEAFQPVIWKLYKKSTE